MDTNQARAELLAKFNSTAVDLAVELDEILKVLRFQRQALTNKMTEGFGYKQFELKAEDAKAATTLTLSYQKAVDAKVKLDKHLKDRAEELTPEQELESVALYIKTLPSTDRRKLLIEALAYHNANTTNSQWFIYSDKQPELKN